MLVLGIESSCDDTGVALYDTDKGLVAHALKSQRNLHKPFGGVVPELASRDHLNHISPLIRTLLTEKFMSVKDLDAVTYTAGPGLVGALLVGAAVARSLAWGLSIPCLGVNHLEGHVMACMLEAEKPDFPFIALLVSGGHTQLVMVEGLGRYQVLGETLDDAVGEAFDKVARLLGLSNAGGAALAKLAEKGSAQRFKLPRPMINRPGLEFSFSGLKTAVMQLINQQTLASGALSEQDAADIAKAFELAVVDTLTFKCARAMKETGSSQLVLVGGVGANTCLRTTLAEKADQAGWQLYYPRQAFCTDNGAMIAQLGAMRLQAGQRDLGLAAEVQPRWPLMTLTPPDK